METLAAPLNLQKKVRFVTATSLFDGHDVSINIMRRLLQQGGAEVVHLGHNRSAQEIIRAAVQEDAHAVAVSCYQGGHNEFFKYLRDLSIQCGRPDLKIFGGGGGVILPQEAKEIERYGVTRIYSPDDGLALGLEGIINDMLTKATYDLTENLSEKTEDQFPRMLSVLESKKNISHDVYKKFFESGKKLFLAKSKETKLPSHVPLVLGITGTGGAGKSSLTDELIRRFTLEFPEKKVCVFSVDPSKKKTGGALLGDRIRMNAIEHPSVFMRSFATRGSQNELSDAIQEALYLASGTGWDLIIVETSGIGQGDAAILSIADLTLYVMTKEYGASSQLEKIDMLDFADFIAINKFDRAGAEDSFKDVKNQLRRSRFQGKHLEDSQYPLFGTMASKFNDTGVNALYKALIAQIKEKTEAIWDEKLSLHCERMSTLSNQIITSRRINYLSEISETVRNYHAVTEEQGRLLDEIEALEKTLSLGVSQGTKDEIEKKISDLKKNALSESIALVKSWPTLKEQYEKDDFEYKVRDKKLSVPLKFVSLAGTKIPKICLPAISHAKDVLYFLRSENVPGSFPFTAGLFPLKRNDEDPKRQFAGEGGPKRTNKRFHYLTENDPAKRLSTAFDSVTLYGEDPSERPDIYGKVGESGVSITTLEDMKTLFSGFDLCDPSTSVSMTINGPAPIILAFFFNAAIDQQMEKERKKLGVKVLDETTAAKIRKDTLKNVRGTVQADILKEVQAQNTCVFSIDFALKMMGDIQEFFIQNEVKNYYSVSISGYHIAEAGANPITQLAFTLANGFTYVEYYLSRGMKVNDFAPNLSFFFSNGMDPEYTVLGRVARRIWAIAMKEKYKADERAQKLKYHIQTSGRSLHAQEIDFNDIRTTLQALLAMADNCNSLHTNAYDEAITTPTEESVRRSMAIQLILAREYGLLKNENPLQGSYFVEKLTQMVEEAVLLEFERISKSGGVTGAMEMQYQRLKIQEESLHYEHLKHSGAYPLIGVNTFTNPNKEMNKEIHIPVARASNEEKSERLTDVKTYQKQNESTVEQALKKLQEAVIQNKNIFEELLNTTRYASLGQITHTLYAVGGKYRRGM